MGLRETTLSGTVFAPNDANGRFSLIGVPPGDNIPLVITTGKWRRQIVVPHVDACTEHPLAPIDTTLPRDRTESDLPRIAIATGLADSPQEKALAFIFFDIASCVGEVL
jgi:hypothetical protein